MRGGLLLAVAIVSMCLPGCQTDPHFETPIQAAMPSIAPPRSLQQSAALQRSLLDEADHIRSGFRELHRSGGWQERGYFDGAEHEAIEALFFRFVVNQAAFWGEIDRHGGSEMLLVREEDGTRAHLLLLHAGLALADTTGALVSEFQTDPIAIAKLNEAFYRSEIPRGSYDGLRLAVTSQQRRDALLKAWSLHERALADPESPLSETSGETLGPEIARLLHSLPPLHAQAIEHINAVQPLEEAWASKLEEELEHSDLADFGRGLKQGLGDAGYETRALVFKDVSRIKSPTAHRIEFSDAQKRQVHSALRPGDILLSYTAGYVSSIFIPGQFKHGMTYVGDAREREAIGLTPGSLPDFDAPVRRRVVSSLAIVELADGRRADLIEAVAEGVKFSNLEQILDTHINRFLVLRPRLAQADRVAFLAGVFAFLGDPYDFRFDFGDASRQVCTEVIYRALEGKQGFNFELTERGGHPTLSADDIVEYHLMVRPEAFDFVLFAAEDPGRSGRQARIWIGDAGEERLREQMSADSEPQPSR